MAATDRKLFRFGDYTLDDLRGCLRVGDREIPLRPKSFELLRCLVENAGRLVSKDELIEAVWRKTIVTDDSLARCISDARSALDDDRQEIIRTVRGRGYLFAATVVAIVADKSISVTGEARVVEAASGDARASPAAFATSETVGRQSASNAPGGPSIVVLPFANMSGRPERDRFAEAITADIIAALSKLRWLTVAAGATHRSGLVSIKQAGAELGASAVLEGSVRRLGDRIRVVGQLVAADSGEPLWADHCDRSIDEDHLAFQDHVTRQFVTAIESVVRAFENARWDREPGGDAGQAPYGGAEHRQLTVMSCELVLPPGWSTNGDLEDLREATAAFQHCVADAVGRFKGFAGHHVGGGVRVYFGYPTAREDDAEQAVRAGLALCTAMQASAIKAKVALACRVGVATGPAIVSDLAGPAEAQERGIVGDVPNAAARLQILAQPGSVAIDAATKLLIGALFDCRRLDAAEPAAWRVLGGSAIRSRFEALRSPDFSPLVGRDEEVEMLRRRWRQSASGAGRVALISGEPGIGKSRLTAALLEHIAGEPHTRLRYFCSPQHEDSALYPIIGQLERVSAIARDDALAAKLAKLDALLMRSGASRQDAALLAEMLSLPDDGRYPKLDFPPQQRRQKTLEALVAQVEALSRRKPVLTIFEDAHWSDPTSLELLGRLIDKVQGLRAMMIVTFRPEFEPPWIGRHHVTAIGLNRLAQDEVADIIDRVVGDRLLPADVRRDIVERTDGVPLFVEEMTKALLEAEDDGTSGRTLSAIPSRASAVPPSLHASLMARLDRLGRAKGVAQIGAAIGGEFSHALLALVARESGPALASALDRLIHAGLLFRQGAPPHATYLFKHALVQDAAYGTLLREPRRALHARISEVLESQFADIVENQPELLARHCAEAGLIEKAVGLWGKAGLRSLARSALREAEAQLIRALAQMAALPGAPGLRRLQIALQIGLANAVMQIKGYAAPETKAAFDLASALIERAEALGEPSEDPLAPFSVLYGFWIGNFVAFNADSVQALAAQFLRLARRRKTIAPLMIGYRLVGNSALLAGDIAEGRKHLDRAFALYDPVAHRPLAPRFGQDVMVAILSWRSLSLWVLGYPDAARADVEHALKDAREIGHAVSLIVALTITTMIRIQCGDQATAKAQLDEAVALADERGALLWKAVGSMFQSAFALTGEASDAVRSFAALLPAYQATGATVVLPFFLLSLARAYAALGQFDEAARRLGEATIAAQQSGERWCDAEIHRVTGEIALMTAHSDTTTAQGHFERAMEIARAQKARSWELRAAASLAQLWIDQGKRRQALDLLAPIHGWFREGFDTPDLQKAKALLDKLAV